METCYNCGSLDLKSQTTLSGIFTSCLQCDHTHWDWNENPCQLKTTTQTKGDDMSATKYDQNKPDLSLIRYDAITPIADVFQFGAAKYGKFNYLQGMSHSRVLAAAARHLFAYMDGQDLDSESGKSHLAHLGCCVHMLLTYRAQNLGTDDRAPKLDKSENK